MTPLRLGFAQRLVIVAGAGAALIALGDFITGLGGGYPSGWTGYAPLPRVLVPYAAGMSAGPRLAVWLVLTALWVAVSLFMLRERASGPASAASTGAAAGTGPDAAATAPEAGAARDRAAGT